MWTLSAIALIIFIISLIIISKNDLPTFEELENPKYKLASLIYDTKNREIGKYYVEKRVNIPFDSLNPYLVTALLNTEDARFYDHTGVDLRATLRVVSKTLLFRDQSSGGGSTITQQLAKLLFERPKFSQNKIKRTFQIIRVKFKEWLIAIELEKSYTKEEIIAMYLNKFEFIYGAHGIEAASETYFGKRQNDLTLSESAMLIGMLKNPALYNPVKNLDLAIERRNTVLNQMKDYNSITRDEYEKLVAEPIDMSSFRKESIDLDPAPYFRMELTKWLKTLIKDKNLRNSNGDLYNIYTDGLKIYTTLDLDYQNDAENAVNKSMKIIQKRYWNSWRGMDPIKYEADNNQINKRLFSIETKIKDSDRYKNLKEKLLFDIENNIKNQFSGLEFNDKESEILIENSDRSKIHDIFKNDRNFSNSSLQKLDDFLASDFYKKYVTQYKNFQLEKEKEFDTKVKMKVFAYNERMEKDTIMSPLDSVIYHIRNLQTGMLVMEPGTGKIKAWVGGVGFNYFKFDHINNRRQVGSTFKPIVYATAISVQGISPCQEFDDIQYSIVPGEGNFHLDKVWAPNNSTETFTGNKYNLYHGLLYSKNSITVKLVKELGNVEVIRDLADNMGIDKNLKINGEYLLPKYPSIALGAADLSLMEMVGAYGTFANDGIYVQPYFVSKIEDKNGKVIYQNIPNQKRALNSMYNYIMVDMLRNNMEGKYSFNAKELTGGKTGTTNDYTDGWFMCITPNVVVGVWTGGDEKWVRFNNLNEGQGYMVARPAVKEFIENMESDKNIDLNLNKKFTIPENKEYLDIIDCSKYKTIKPEVEYQMNVEKKKKRDQFDDEF
ncbi:MAG: transglycosylase domain-containing protein [Saprospiraceae bacterium]